MYCSIWFVPLRTPHPPFQVYILSCHNKDNKRRYKLAWLWLNIIPHTSTFILSLKFRVRCPLWKIDTPHCPLCAVEKSVHWQDVFSFLRCCFSLDKTASTKLSFWCLHSVLCLFCCLWLFVCIVLVLEHFTYLQCFLSFCFLNISLLFHLFSDITHVVVVHPKMKMYPHRSCKPVWGSFFCWTRNKICWWKLKNCNHWLP